MNANVIQKPWRPSREKRTLALKVIRGYRTMSSGAATVLTGSPPWELEAEVLAAVYKYTVARRNDRGCPALVDVQDIRQRAHAVIMRGWTEDLADARYKTYTNNFIRQVLIRFE